MLPLSKRTEKASPRAGPTMVPCFPAMAGGIKQTTRWPGWNSNSSSKAAGEEEGAEVEAGEGAGAAASLRFAVVMLKTLPESNRTAKLSPKIGPITEPCLPAKAGGPVSSTRCPGSNSNSSSEAVPLEPDAAAGAATGAAVEAAGAEAATGAEASWRFSVAMLKMLPLSKRTAKESPSAGPMTVPCCPAMAGGPRSTTSWPSEKANSSSPVASGAATAAGAEAAVPVADELCKSLVSTRYFTELPSKRTVTADRLGWGPTTVPTFPCNAAGAMICTR
mmetsp:Transcript_6363/g.11364  ORF Transcript_6363/g.11364 Transcript_6363/m.11364 type:complete len:277 (+) Transcript_6363:363-1193(+)